MDKKQDKQAHKFGLVGRNIDYSFSRGYFSKKFEAEQIPHTYQNFDIPTIENFPTIIKNTSKLKGLNVTIPYKQSVIPFLDDLAETAKHIGAVNTIQILDNGKLIGHNTDYYGFKTSLSPLLKSYHKKALILGTGGASKAVAYALKHLNIAFDYVSRTQKNDVTFTYKTLSETIISQYQIIINCTPMGTFPNIEESPDILYSALNETHILYDLIYNPEETKFLKLGKQKGATTINGLKMLKLQAEKAWEIWQL